MSELGELRLRARVPEVNWPAVSRALSGLNPDQWWVLSLFLPRTVYEQHPPHGMRHGVDLDIHVRPQAPMAGSGLTQRHVSGLIKRGLVLQRFCNLIELTGTGAAVIRKRDPRLEVADHDAGHHPPEWPYWRDPDEPSHGRF